MTKLSIKELSASFRIGTVCLALICGVAGTLSAQSPIRLVAQETYVPAGDGLSQIPYITRPLPSVGLKTNLLYAATLTPNLALEFGLGKKTSLEVGGGYNFYEPDSGKQWKHWLVQPEFRYWFCERFNGSFIGAHALGGEYNFAKIDLPLSVFDDLEDYRYEGYYYGGGIVFGHQWVIGKRWNLEAAIGAGYVRVQYDKYNCDSCGNSIENGFKNYWGPTKATLSFILFL